MTIEIPKNTISCDLCAGVADMISRTHEGSSPQAISGEIIREMGEINDNCPSETTCLPLMRQVEILRELQKEAEKENLSKRSVN